MLAIEVEFLTGRYVATAYNSRLDAEWPPHPARLFSALAATHFASDPPAAEERTALEWLAAQAPPSIRAADESARDVVKVFVPVNDVALTNVDAEAAELDEVGAALDAARVANDLKAIKKAASAVAKAEQRLAKAITDRTGLGRVAGNPATAVRVLPEYRVRQPRTFPSVTPTDPRVTYVWPAATPTAAQREAIDSLLQRLVRLGHSSSLVVARLVDEPVTPVWRPADDGETVLRTVQAGQLGALERAFALHSEADPRVLPARFEGYTRRSPAQDAPHPRSTFSDAWLVLRRVGGPSLPMTAAARVSRTIRKALLRWARLIPEVLSGHTEDRQPSERDHLAIVPLPFIAHPHASGGILGVALILPRDVDEDDRRAVFAAVDAWEGAERREDEDTPRLPVHLGGGGVLELERLDLGGPQASLRAATWCGPSSVWYSATPVALDHNPGDLHSRDPAKLARALEEARTTIRRACVRIGLPEPVAVEILPAPPLAGAAKARHYPPFPEQADRTRRVLSHARMEFSMPIRGPVLLGAGRYVGLGLFRPEGANG